MGNKLRSKSFYQDTLLTGLLSLSFVSLTGFGMFFSSVLILIPLSPIAYYLAITATFNKLLIDRNIINYSVIIIILFLCNALAGSSFNFLLFTPIISFLFFQVLYLSRKGRMETVVDCLVKLLVIGFLVVAVLELTVKLNGFDFLGYKTFLLEYGDRRIDVLRARTLFGSPLSTAALCIFFFTYFSFFRRSYLFFLLSIVLAFFSGSRTAIVLLILAIFFSGLLRIYQGRVKRKALFLLVASIPILGAIAAFTPIGEIFVRAISLRADASFVGRSSSTIQTAQDLLGGLPVTLLVGLQGKWISDSAITSIMAGSGVLAFIAFFGLFLGYLIKVNIPNFYKCAISLIVILGAAMIGDFFVPAVSFLYFMIFMVYSKGRVAPDAPPSRSGLPYPVAKT